jgi:uncharacterized membrane protein
MKTNQKIILILLFIIVGATIRLYNIGFQFTNFDEEFTLNFASPSLSALQVLSASLTKDYTPPIYYLLAHFSMVVFGQNPTAIRIPSVIFGVLLIPVMYLIGKEYKDDLFGVLLSGLSTVFYCLYFYSKYGRSYSVAIFFFSLVFYSFIRILKGDQKVAVWFGLFSVLSIWSHIYSVIPIGVMVLYLLWKRRVLTGIAVIVVGLIPLIYFYAPLVLNTRISGVASNTFGYTPAQLLSNIPFDLFGYSAVVILPVVIWTIWKHREEEIIALISIISLTTLASLFAFSTRTPIIPHYAIFLLTMLLVVFVIPIWENIKIRWSTVYIFVITLVLVMEFYQIYLLNFVQRLFAP